MLTGKMMQKPVDAPCALHLPIRLRRNRRSEAIRNMTQETKLSAADLVVPIFLIEGEKQKRPIASMPGIERVSIDVMLNEVEALYMRGVQSVALFPVVDRTLRTDGAEEAWNPEGLLARAIRALKREVPDVCVMADVALDPFTSHGH